MAKQRIDYVFLVLLAILIAFGLVMLTSATGPFAYQKFQDSYWFVKHQMLYGLLPGALLFLFFSRFDYRRLRPLALPCLILSILLLITVFIPGLAAPWGTSHSWITLLGFSLQPAELVKLAFLIYVAARFSAKDDPERVASFAEGLVPFVLTLGAIAALMLAQPDLGTLLVIAAASFCVYFVAGAAWSHIALLGAVGVAGMYALIKAAPYRAARLLTFLHPELDPKGVGYHINQAFLAIGSGGLFGLGLGHSKQKFLYLPEVAGDSIFAVASEELGFVVMLLVLAAILAFIYRGIRIARQAPDSFGRLLVSGIMGWVFFQMLFNIGSMVGIFPLTGVPLPFISYGGTAMMVLLAAMGIVANVSRQAGEGRAR